MGWSDRIDRNTLRHIIALFLSLASIADLGVNQTSRRRRELIVLLRRSEASGLRLLGWSDATDAEVAECLWSYEPEDFQQIAVSLRALAIALHHMSRFWAVSDDARHNAPEWEWPRTGLRQPSAPSHASSARLRRGAPLNDTS